MQEALAGIQQYGSVALIGWASGINLYLATALAGICGRMGLLPLPGELDVIKNPLIIAVAVLLYAVQFVADKVPYVDSFWDSFHTVIRPGAAAVMGGLAGAHLGPVPQTLLSIGAGTFALNMHAAKASTRLAINTSPEPFSNIAASLAEDSSVVAMFWFFIKHPWLALALMILILVLSFMLIRLLWRFAKKLFKALLSGRNPAQDDKDKAAGTVSAAPPPSEKGTTS